jgi:hypothetical protein
MPTRQVERANERQLKKDFFKGAKVGNILSSMNSLTEAINDINLNFYALFELLKDKAGITENDFFEKRKSLIKNATEQRKGN